MINEVEEILSHSFKAIVSDGSLVMKFLSVYSKLYLGGKTPKMCSLCHANYYNELLKTGRQMAIKHEEIKNRTCAPKWNGLKYIGKTGKHWNSDFITDKDAIYLLSNDFLTEESFTVLPENYRIEGDDAFPSDGNEDADGNRAKAIEVASTGLVLGFSKKEIETEIRSMGFTAKEAKEIIKKAESL